jgi:hypothetical protein
MRWAQILVSLDHSAIHLRRRGVVISRWGNGLAGGGGAI